jgi:hypothetical protein
MGQLPKNATNLGAWLDCLHAWVESMHGAAIATATLAAAMERRTPEENDHEGTTHAR